MGGLMDLVNKTFEDLVQSENTSKYHLGLKVSLFL